MIDPHVHLRDWEHSRKETLYHGLRTAARAGISGVFDMPNTAPPLTSREMIEKRLVDAAAAQEKAAHETGEKIFYGLFGGLVADEKQIREMVKLHGEFFPAMVGLKLFTVHSTGDMGIISQLKRKLILNTLSVEGYTGVLAVHCEKHELLKPELWNPSDSHSHSAARPPEAESVSIQKLVETALETGFSGTLHICHISTPQSLACIEQARRNVPFLITCGVTPHHALLDTSIPQKDNLLKVNPPLRDPDSREAMFRALVDGRIDWIESDHAPHLVEDKRDGGSSGIPGIAGYLLLVRELLRAGVSSRQINYLTGNRVCEVFNLDSLCLIDSSVDESGLTVRAQEAADEYSTDPYKSCGFLG